jgi:hypothetical protein
MNPLYHWHTMLAMPIHDAAWHQQDLEDELAEYHEATGLIDTWSELSDVAYTCTRAHWSGHTNIPFPLSRIQYVLGILYMLPKYSLRWRFFRRLGHHFDDSLHISEVRNPRKVAKLHTLAEKYHLDPIAFQIEAEHMLKHTFLLK